jgi:hypothetical protein
MKIKSYKIETCEAYVNETLVQEEGQRQECCKVQTKKKERKNKIHQNLYAHLENSRDQVTIIQ